MTKEMNTQLIEAAIEARRKSYSPYSGFSVGAALLCASGKIYTGANIESASYTPTVCAERVAFFSAVHSGERDFTAIAIVGGMKEISDFVAPCGVCRQVMAEFVDPDFEIILYNGTEARVHTFKEIFPFSFGRSDLK